MLITHTSATHPPDVIALGRKINQSVLTPKFNMCRTTEVLRLIDVLEDPVARPHTHLFTHMHGCKALVHNKLILTIVVTIMPGFSCLFSIPGGNVDRHSKG